MYKPTYLPALYNTWLESGRYVLRFRLFWEMVSNCLVNNGSWQFNFQGDAL